MSPSVERSAKALWGFGSSNFDWEEYVPDAQESLAAALGGDDIVNTISNLLYRYDHEENFGVLAFTDTLRAAITGADK